MATCWPKPSGEIEAALDEALAGTGAMKGVLFGCPTYSIRGELFAGVHGRTVFLRLGPADRLKVMAEGGRPFEPLEGRSLRMYAVLPESIATSRRKLEAWLGRAFGLAEPLGPKRWREPALKKTKKKGRKSPRRKAKSK